MKRLGKTRLHKIVAAETGDSWSEQGRSEAESYLTLNSGLTYDQLDVSHALGNTFNIESRNHVQQILEHAPEAVVAAFDQVRQDELDYQQGAVVTLEITDRDLKSLRSILNHALRTLDSDEFTNIAGTSSMHGAEILKDLHDALNT